MTTAVCPDCGQNTPVEGGRFVKHGDCPGWFARINMPDAQRDRLESRFTDPRPDCPHPERWHSDDADSTEHEVSALVAAFVRALRPDVVVETGSAWGQTAAAIGDALVGYGHLWTIEPDPVRAEATRARCAEMPVTVVESKSLDWEPVDGIGFIWLDSLHHLRITEFRKFRPHMATGAFVGFHDTGPHQASLRADVEALETEGLLLPVFLPTPRGVCFAEVC